MQEINIPKQPFGNGMAAIARRPNGHGQTGQHGATGGSHLCCLGLPAGWARTISEQPENCPLLRKLETGCFLLHPHFNGLCRSAHY
jgi:hypothetical protein